MEKKGFFASLGKRKLGVVLNLFYAYMSLGLVLIMLGAILPELKADYALSYQVGGALLSVQSVGYVLAKSLLPITMQSFLQKRASANHHAEQSAKKRKPVWHL